MVNPTVLCDIVNTTSFFDPSKSENDRIESHYQSLDNFMNFVQINSGYKPSMKISTVQNLGSKEKLIDNIAAEERSLIPLLYPNVSRRLENFRKMRSNWEFGDDKPATDETIDLAYKVLSRLEQIARKLKIELPQPYVYMTPDGSIQYEWEFQDKEFDLEIADANGRVAYFALAQPSSDPETWLDDEGKIVADKIGWLHPIKKFLSWL